MLAKAFPVAAALLLVGALLSMRPNASAAEPERVRAKIAAGAKVVDVRTPAEFAAGSYPGAINVPLADIEKRLKDFGDPKRPVVVFCRSGNRSGQAKAILERHGFTDVTNGGGLKDMPR